MSGYPEASASLPKAVLVNAGRLDFDNGLDFSKTSAAVELCRFESDPTDDEILERVQGQEIIITKEIPLSGQVISKFPDSVKVIQEAGTGVNNVDLAAAKAKGLTVLFCPAYSSDAFAHMVITFALNFSCSLVPQMRMLQKGNRENFSKCLQVPHFELAGKTIGLIGGSGGIGSKVASVAEALGMKVIITSRSPKPNAVPLDELLRTSDFVSLHCPLNSETKGLLDKQRLELMKPTAFLINTARGGLINEEDLIEVLKAGKIAGAGLDVQVTEPPADDNPLYELENVILTPHIGWKRLETRQRLMGMVADNLEAYKQGKPTNVVALP
jgi:glycerate dehydrogenase